jgi:hypothetical protein
MGNYGRYFDGSGELYDPRDVPDAAAQLELRCLALGVLDPLREAVAGPIIITSGFRSPGHNAAIGGASQSQHIFGRATDVANSAHTGYQLFQKAAVIRPREVVVPDGKGGKKSVLVALGGLGLYAPYKNRGSFIHVDTRPRVGGRIVTWYRNEAGVYTSLPAEVQKWLTDRNIAFAG